MEYRYIDIDENGRIEGYRTVPLETSIDTEGMSVPEMPTDAIYDLYYNEIDGLHWVKAVNFFQAEPTQDELQWRAITDLEISQMEYDQALTDLEIAYLEGSAKV